MIVGITGPYCSGKSLVSDIFSSYGFTIIDVDLIGHEALKAKKKEIYEVFGGDVFSGEVIDRKKLGMIVFGDSEKRRNLERIVHPWMIRRVKELVQNERKAVINAALLIEMCLFVLCDFVIGISVEEEIAINRGVMRDGITEGEARQRFQAQIPLKEKLHYVDKVIENSWDKKVLIEKMHNFISNFLIKV